jgi:hypothetical protein
VKLVHVSEFTEQENNICTCISEFVSKNNGKEGGGDLSMHVFSLEICISC